MYPIFKKQERATLTIKALNQVRKAISSGKIKSGDRLVEAELARQMQISRFPIREAICYLEKEGLVVTIPFKGTYVANFSEKDLEELYTLRSALEELAIRLLMDNLDNTKIKKLDSILASMERAAVEGKVDKLISEDMRFHRTICELSGHRKLLEIWLTLERQLRTFITLEEYYYEKADQFARTHHPVLEAIKSGNINIAERSIRDHLYQALDFIKRKYGKASSNREKN